MNMVDCSQCIVESDSGGIVWSGCGLAFECLGVACLFIISRDIVWRVMKHKP